MNRLTRHVALLAGSASLLLGVVGVHAGSASGAGAAPSGRVANPYSPAYGHPYRHGAVPTIAQNNKMRAYASTHPATRNVTGPQTLSFGGGIDGIGVTSGTPKIYLVFWGSQWGSQSTNGNGNLTFSNDPSGGAPYLQQLFKGLGTGGELWSGTMTQYCDGSTVASGATSCPSGAPLVGYPSGGALAGVWYDNSAAEPSPATGHQIGQEAVNAAGHFGNTTAASNRYAQYDILSSTGLNPDNWLTGGYCAWHDYNGDSTLTGGGVTSPYGDIAFTNQPYVPDQGSSCGQNFVNAGANGTNDGYSIVGGHEYAETVTDQNPAGGWTNHTGNATYNGQENGDECAWLSSGQGASANVSTGTGSFAMQSTWSNDTNRCDISHPIVGGTVSNNFSISENPTSGSVTAGSAATTTVSTAVTSGSAQTVSLSASGLPTGASASFNPASVTAGGSSTLTISTSSSTPAGTYAITITGTGTSATHTTSYSLTVSPGGGGGGGVTNGGFETGSFAGWTTSGTTAITTSGPHGGTYAALAGSSSPTNGDSSISQTFSAPTGSSTLSFWYNVTCPDTLTYDWATATLRDNTTATTTTPLAKTCVSSSGWKQVSASVTAGHSYTLTLTSHDDNYASDPTYTKFDDVALAAPASNNFSISDNPTSGSVTAGSAATTTVSTAVTSGSAQTVSLSASGLPTGASASFNPASITAGGSSTLTISTSSSTPAGTYAITITGTGTSATHTTSYSLTVSPAGGGGGVTNGGFETGSFAGWTTSGTTAITTSGPHSGTYAGLAGSSSPTNGDSSISQTFSVPTGKATLSFWYNVTCPDTLTYDWATATLRDNTTATTTTPLGRTCVSSSGWTQVSVTVTAGHSYTLTLTSHDDNYPGDPTFTKFDDVALS